jgi:hypothetical protein
MQKYLDFGRQNFVPWFKTSGPELDKPNGYGDEISGISSGFDDVVDWSRGSNRKQHIDDKSFLETTSLRLNCSHI